MKNPLPTPTAGAPLLLVLLLSPLAFVVGAAAQPDPPEPPTLDAEDRAAVIDRIVEALDETYIFADVAAAMGRHLRAELGAGRYDDFETVPEFTRRLTEDLQSISNDRHLRVAWDPDRPPAEPDPEDEARRQHQYAERLRGDNYCFRKLERLAGNVGLIKLDCFAPAELGGATAVAAMGFLAHVDALIFDLRDNGGGSPSMIQFVTSYLVEEPTHLNSFYIRETDETRQFWTPAHVAGERLDDVPVWVLTSNRTFSGAEEFSYNLRNLERATLVGETTGGGAHPVRTHWIEGYPVRMSLPYGRAVNPITGTNWEGTGVEPHVPVAADEALDVAYAAALRTLAESADDEADKTRLSFLGETVELRRAPVELAVEELRAFVGTFGPRHVRLEDGHLLYSRDGGTERELIPAGEDRFLVGDLDWFRLRFERDPDGQVVRLVGLYQDGRQEPSERSE